MCDAIDLPCEWSSLQCSLTFVAMHLVHGSLSCVGVYDIFSIVCDVLRDLSGIICIGYKDLCHLHVSLPSSVLCAREGGNDEGREGRGIDEERQRGKEEGKGEGWREGG